MAFIALIVFISLIVIAILSTVGYKIWTEKKESKELADAKAELAEVEGYLDIATNGLYEVLADPASSAVHAGAALGDIRLAKQNNRKRLTGGNL